MGWRLAHALEQLRAEVNTAYPHRLKASDGTIGDPRHVGEGTGSDHNPWVIDDHGIGVVRAIDITAAVGDRDPAHVSGDWLAEHVRRLGASGFAPLRGFGYVIWNRRIASAQHGWVWRPYDGDPHTNHVHVSVSRDQGNYDSGLSWSIAHAVAPPPVDSDGMGPGDRGGNVEFFQAMLNILTPFCHLGNLRPIAQDGVWGAQTTARTVEFQRWCVGMQHLAGTPTSKLLRVTGRADKATTGAVSYWVPAALKRAGLR